MESVFDCRLHLVVYMESVLPKGLPRYGTALEEVILETFALLAEMTEHAYGHARRKLPEVELPSPTVVVSYSPATLSSL